MGEFNIDLFRLNFPEFSDSVRYTDSMINYWASIGNLMLNPDRWDKLRELGLSLFIAHEITLQVVDEDSKIPGTDNALTNTMSSGPISIGFDTSSVLELDGGNYNLTSYGTRFLRLVRLVGIGGLQL